LLNSRSLDAITLDLDRGVSIGDHALFLKHDRQGSTPQTRSRVI